MRITSSVARACGDGGAAADHAHGSPAGFEDTGDGEGARTHRVIHTAARQIQGE